MIGWAGILIYELLAILLSRRDRQEHISTPAWREPMTRSVWRIHNKEWWARLFLWAISGTVVGHLLVEPVIHHEKSR